MNIVPYFEALRAENVLKIMKYTLFQIWIDYVEMYK